MTYNIGYFVNSRLTATESWDGTFSAAQEMARKAVESGTAERVEIRESDGALVFHHPRVSHVA